MKTAISYLLFPLGLILLTGCGGEEAVQAGATSSNEELAGTYRPDEPATATLTGRASKKGDVMPDYTANDLNGGTWRLADEDGVTMLNLWATWCGPCRYEIPELIELQKEFGDQGLQVVGVSMDRRGMEEKIDTFAENAGINYKIVHDPQATLADVFETTIIPTTALINRDGKIIWFHAGIVSGDDPDLREALESTLGNPSQL